jgi:hypothetical protein
MRGILHLVIAKLRKDTTEGTLLVLKGTMIMVAENFLTLDTGFQLVNVNTQILNEKATDNNGKIRVKAGDEITVHGSVTDGFFDSNKLIATRVIEK